MILCAPFCFHQRYTDYTHHGSADRTQMPVIATSPSAEISGKPRMSVFCNRVINNSHHLLQSLLAAKRDIQYNQRRTTRIHDGVLIDKTKTWMTVTLSFVCCRNLHTNHSHYSLYYCVLAFTHSSQKLRMLSFIFAFFTQTYTPYRYTKTAVYYAGSVQILEWVNFWQSYWRNTRWT